MMAVFDELLSIKRFRESQAELAVARERRHFHEAEMAYGAQRRSLEDFRAWAERREHDLYDDLCSRQVRVREIENVLQDVAGLRDGERQREQRVLEAGELLNQARKNLDGERVRHREATRHTEKFVELAQIHLAAHIKVIQDKEELELEEVATQARDRDEWQEHDVYDPAYSEEY